MDIATQKDGKIIAVGYKYTNLALTGTRNTAIAIRLNYDGSIDRTFAGDGIAEYNFDSEIAQFRTINIQSDGKIVISGLKTNKPAVFRLLSNGLLDTTFGISGAIAFDELSNICAIEPQSNKFVLMGATRKGVHNVLFRIDRDGIPDPSFGNEYLDTIKVSKFENGTNSYGKCPLLVDTADNSVYIATNDKEPRVNKFSCDGAPDLTFPGFGPKDYFHYGWPLSRVEGYPEPGIPRALFLTKEGYFAVVGRTIVEFEGVKPEYKRQVYGYLTVIEPKNREVEVGWLH